MEYLSAVTRISKNTLFFRRIIFGTLSFFVIFDVQVSFRQVLSSYPIVLLYKNPGRQR